MRKIFSLAFLLLLTIFSTSIFGAADWKGPKLNGPPSGANMLGNGPDSSKIKTKYLEVPYVEKGVESQKLDIYIPNEGKGPFPVIIAIHGGAFFGGDKYDAQLDGPFEGVQRGYAVVSINYRLSPEAKWPAQINDVKAAIKFLRVNAKKYNLNSDKFGIWGTSAGGNLAALAGVTPGVTELEDVSLGNIGVSTKIQAVVTLFPAIDFLKMDEQWEEVHMNGEKHSTIDSFESYLMREQITKIPDLVKATNPENYVNPFSPPHFIQSGTLDETLPCVQAKNYADKLRTVLPSDKVQFEYLVGAKHGHGQKDFFESQANQEKIFKFLDKYLK